MKFDYKNDDEIRRTIKKVFNTETQQEECVIEILNKPEQERFEIRRTIEERIQENDFLYLCTECCQPLVLRCHEVTNRGKHVHYFKHMNNSADCTLKRDSSLTNDEALKKKLSYIKEGIAHKKSKKYLSYYLSKDRRFSDVLVEKTIKGTTEIWKDRWKRPDVQAVYQKDKKFIFEVQLSPTFLSIIVSRERFYQSEGHVLFWVFQEKFDPSELRAFEKDILVNSKSNFFSINKTSRRLSAKYQKLIFAGYYKTYSFNNSKGVIDEIWQKKYISFEDLSIDDKTHMPYFYDNTVDYELACAKKRKYDEYLFAMKQFEIEYDLEAKQHREFCAYISKINEIYAYHNLLQVRRYRK